MPLPHASQSSEPVSSWNSPPAQLTPDACAVAVDGVEVGVTWKPKGKKGETYDLSKYAGGAVLLVFAVPRGAVLYAYHV